MSTALGKISIVFFLVLLLVGASEARYLIDAIVLPPMRENYEGDHHVNTLRRIIDKAKSTYFGVTDVTPSLRLPLVSIAQFGFF